MDDSTTDVATLAGGCFWCLEAVYEQLSGVGQVRSGYSGGRGKNPSYEQVCSGTTGHAEVVQARFDPRRISYAELLDVFFTIHDPTTLNRQGADIGTQYRSAIYYHSGKQRIDAEEKIAELETAKIWDQKIVTEIVRFEEFFPAEEYHSQYFQRNPLQPYCQAVIYPKVATLYKKFPEKINPGTRKNTG